MLLKPREVEIHLAFVGSGECAKLEINGHEAMQTPVEEEQVEEVIGIINPHPILSGYEAEIGSQLRQELLQVTDDRALEILFGISSLESEKIQNIWILENILLPDFLRHTHLPLQSDKLAGIPREGDPLEQGACDPAIEFTG